MIEKVANYLNQIEETEKLCSSVMIDKVATYFKTPTVEEAMNSFLSLMFDKVANFFNNAIGGGGVVRSMVASFSILEKALEH